MTEITNRTLSIERTFNAPLKSVWEAWTKAEDITNWWVSKGMDFSVVEHNFEVGGSWKYIMKMPDGSEFISDGVYSEIIHERKIETSANFKPMTEGVILVATFEAAGEQTKFSFSVIHETEEYCKQQEQMGFYKGWGSVFDRLQSLVESGVQ